MRVVTRWFVGAGITERVWTAATNVAEVAVGTVGMAVDTVTGKVRVHAQAAIRSAACYVADRRGAALVVNI
jgi:hypothetical protein